MRRLSGSGSFNQAVAVERFNPSTEFRAHVSGARLMCRVCGSLL